MTRASVLTGVAVAALFAAAAAAQTGAEIGVNAAIRGDVFQTPSAAAERARAVVSGKVRLGDRVDSQADSALQILLLDETTFTLGPNADVVIDRFVYDPARGAGEMSAAVTKGFFRFMTGNIGARQPSAVDVRTPVASIGIRGTVLEGVIGAEAIEIAGAAGVPTAGADSDAAGLFVLRGPGRDATGLDRKGAMTISSGGVSKTTRTSGAAFFVPSDGAAPFGPFVLDEAGFDAFSAVLRTRPTGAPFDPPLDIGSVRRASGELFDDVAGPLPTAPRIDDLPVTGCEPNEFSSPGQPTSPGSPGQGGCLEF